MKMKENVRKHWRGRETGLHRETATSLAHLLALARCQKQVEG